MHPELNLAAKALITRDADGDVREVVHEAPVVSTAATAQQAAEEYLAHHAELLGIKPTELTNLAMARESEPGSMPEEYRLRSEKQQFDTTTVTYDQTCLGLPIWEAGL